VIAIEYPDTFVRHHNGLEKLSAVVKRQKLVNPEGIILRTWQQTIYDELQGPIDSREIKWIYDSSGDTGKSFFAKYYWIKHKNECFFSTGGKHDRILHAYNLERVVIFDFSRDYRSTEDGLLRDRVPYNVLEQLKNGAIGAGGMYGAGAKLCDPPHLIVFANFLPTVEKMSLGRWNIRELYKGPGDVEEFFFR